MLRHVLIRTCVRIKDLCRDTGRGTRLGIRLVPEHALRGYKGPVLRTRVLGVGKEMPPIVCVPLIVRLNNRVDATRLVYDDSAACRPVLTALQAHLHL